MAVTPIGASGAAQLREPLGRSSLTSRAADRPAPQAQDQVTLSSASKAAGPKAEERELRLSPAELRALVAPEGQADPTAAAKSGGDQSAAPNAWTRLLAGDRGVR